ncbi:MAG: AsmA-like C-terminal region-containing protein [Bacteroidota bacterium]
MLIFSGVLFLVLTLFGTVYYVAFTDQHRVPEIVTRIAKEKLNVELGFSGYEFSCTTGFPYFSLTLKDVFIKGEHEKLHNKELLRVKTLSFKFQPIKFIRKIYMAHEVELDSVSVNIYKDSLGISNLDFLKLLQAEKDSVAISQAKTNGEKEKSIIDLDIVRFHNLQFSFIDDFRHKAFQFDMPIAIANLGQVNTFHDISFDAECNFHQLLFKQENGPFLKNKTGKIRLDIELDDTYHQMKLLPSTLQVDENVFHLSGSLINSDTNFLELKIKNDGILLTNALPLLSDKIQENLSKIIMDAPVAAEVTITGGLIPGFPPSIRADFMTENNNLTFDSLHVQHASLSGRFLNDCNVFDRIGPHTGCLEIDSLTGQLMGNIPLQLTGTLTDLRSFKKIATDFYLNIPLVELNHFVPAKQRMNFLNGNAILEGHFTGNPKMLVNRIINKQLKGLVGDVELSNTSFKYGAENLLVENVSGAISFGEADLSLNNIKFTMPGMVGSVTGRISNFLPVMLGANEQVNSELKVNLRKLNSDKFLNVFTKNNASKKLNEIPFEEKIAEIIKSVHKNTSLKIDLSVDEFQHKEWEATDVSFGLQITHVDSLYQNEPYLKVDQLEATIFDEVTIKNSFSIKNLDDPHLILNLLAELPAQALNRWLPKDTFQVKQGTAEVLVDMEIPLRNFSQTDSLLDNLQLKGNAWVKNVHAAYLPENKVFQKINSSVRFNENQLTIDSLLLDYEGLALKTNGKLEKYLPVVFGKKEPLTAQLLFNLPILDIKDLQFLSNRENRFSPKQLTGFLSDLLNYANGNFDFSIAEFKSSEYHLDDVFFSAQLMDYCAQSPDGACLSVNDFRAEMWGSTPVQLNLELTNFADPFLDLHLSSQIPFKELGRFVPDDLFSFYKGVADLKMDYAGKLQEKVNAENYILNADFDGTIFLKNGEFDYNGRGLEFRNIHGEIHFDENNLSFHDLVLLLNKNRIKAQGFCPRFIPYFFTEGQQFHIDFDLFSPKIDFDYFLTPEELGIDDTQFEGKEEKHIIEEILETGAIEMALKIDQVYIGHFDPKYIDGRVKVSADEIELKELNMKVANGGFYIHGHISDIEKHNPKAEIAAKFTENNIREVFKSFENFGQSDMTHENINGTFNSAVNLNASMDANYEIVPSSLSGDMRIRIDNGELINLEALKNLTGFIFRKRKLDNIAFDTLTTTATLNGFDLEVDQFFVHSTSFDFGVDGVYHLGPHDKTNLLFEIPLGNIFKRHIDKEILMQHDTKRKGPPIMVSATEKNNRLHFKLHLLKGRSKLKK